MGKKVLIGSASAILLVAAVVGIVAMVSRSSHKIGDDFTAPSGDPLLSSTKSIAAFCAPTLYRKACEQTLTVATNGSTNTADLIKSVIKVALDEVQDTLSKSSDVGKGVNDSITKDASEDCKKLLGDAAADLESIFELAGNLQDFLNRTDDLRHWLTAIMTFQDNCVDGFQDPQLKAAMQTVVQNSTELSSNALAIVTSLNSLAQSLNLPMIKSVSRRRLLGHEEDSVYEMDESGYPKWLSAGDRKLLAAGNSHKLRPNAVVAKDGSGNFKSINDAINAVPKKNKGRYVIYVKAGVYNENVLITKDKPNIYMYGDGPKKTRVVGSRSNTGGYATFNTATFAVEASGFICKYMGFSNTAGPQGHQAVALRVQGDNCAFFNVRMDGYQDTLYSQARRHFFRNCVISGTVDFIFGNSAVVLQNCLILVRRPLDNQQNTVTANGRTEANQVSGIVIQNSRIVPDRRLFPDRFKIPSYLGRPWKQYSRTVVMESLIGDLIKPAGWMPWDGDFALKTLYYAEYGNRGPGAGTSKRVNWPGFHVIGRGEAQKFTVTPFINGNLWLKYTGVPSILGLKH
ncbi:putative pectinesterase/pectinesterase inhibitor 45 [Typha angustifolia]|uniref:putative pectinesterase/pectinesterase inhibitor 45 n=1 Tax=Typha angustifolia TaxID=59011 RepID=UPI003C2B9DF6